MLFNIEGLLIQECYGGKVVIEWKQHHNENKSPNFMRMKLQHNKKNKVPVVILFEKVKKKKTAKKRIHLHCNDHKPLQAWQWGLSSYIQ